MFWCYVCAAAHAASATPWTSVNHDPTKVSPYDAAVLPKCAKALPVGSLVVHSTKASGPATVLAETAGGFALASDGDLHWMERIVHWLACAYHRIEIA
jgi:hypothetical protein